jgi:hypothetical protein
VLGAPQARVAVGTLAVTLLIEQQRGFNPTQESSPRTPEGVGYGNASHRKTGQGEAVSVLGAVTAF